MKNLYSYFRLLAFPNSIENYMEKKCIHTASLRVITYNKHPFFLSRELPNYHPELDTRSRQYEFYSAKPPLTNGIKASKESCLKFLRFKFSSNSSTSRKVLLRNL